MSTSNQRMNTRIRGHLVLPSDISISDPTILKEKLLSLLEKKSEISDSFLDCVLHRQHIHSMLCEDLSKEGISEEVQLSLNQRKDRNLDTFHYMSLRYNSEIGQVNREIGNVKNRLREIQSDTVTINSEE